MDINIRLPAIVIGALVFLLCTVLVLAIGFGIAVQRYKIPPYGYIADIEAALKTSVDMGTGTLPWFYRETEREPFDSASYGVRVASSNLVTAVGPDGALELKVVDDSGSLIHSWPVDWFDIWPDATHLLPHELPKSRPGTHIHGASVLAGGDVVFNFEKLGMVRMGVCGDIQWQLPYRTHHSIFIDDNDDIWAAGQSENFDVRSEYPLHVAPIREPIIVRVSPSGEILQKISVFDLLKKNGQSALLYMRGATISNVVSDDSLHLNDVEVFPLSMEEGVFKHGDVMISLRNIHTVLVFDPESLEIRFIQVGGFVRQHDPDFVDGNTITLFDNNHVGSSDSGQQSRIVKVDAEAGTLEVVYSGTEEFPFYSKMMGKHQWLDNGNLLITDSVSGRAFEVSPDGDMQWEFVNFVDDGLVGIVEEVSRLSEAQTATLSASSCNNTAL